MGRGVLGRGSGRSVGPDGRRWVGRGGRSGRRVGGRSGGVPGEETANDVNDLLGVAIGLGKAFGGAGFPGFLDHVAEVGIGEDNDGQFFEAGLGAYFLEQVEAGDFGEHQVEDDGIRVKRADQFKTGGAIGSDLDLEILHSKLVAVDIGDELVVLDDQDFLHVRSWRAGPAPWSRGIS